MATRIPAATQNAACDAVVDAVDEGTTNSAGKLLIYSGSQPATGGGSIGGSTLLAEVDLDNPAFSAASAGVATLLGTPLSTTGLAPGTAAWFRIVDCDETAVLDGSAGTSGTELILNTATISIGVSVQVTSGTITMPASE